MLTDQPFFGPNLSHGDVISTELQDLHKQTLRVVTSSEVDSEQVNQRRLGSIEK